MRIINTVAVMFVVLVIFGVSIVHASECDDQYFKGRRPEPVNAAMKTRLTPVCSPNGFESINWGLSRTGLWSAEHLTPERVANGKRMKRVDSFHEDDTVPSSDRASLSDYARSGFDRGHLSPNKDMDSKRTQEACFTLANMVPQNPDNNRNLWEGIESSVRQYVTDHGDVYVITGPIFPGHGQQAEFLKGRVMVPINMYKIVYDPRLNKAAAYLTKNAPGMAWEQKSIAEISDLAQINFFPWMSDRQKNERGLDLPTPTPHGYSGKGGFHNEASSGGEGYKSEAASGAYHLFRTAHTLSRFFH